MDGIYFTEIDGESNEFELIRFKNNQTFVNFHGSKSGNELGKGLFNITNDTLVMEFEAVESVTVFDRTDTFPDLSLKVMPSITFLDKKLGTGVGGVKIYVMGEEDKAVISDYAGIANLPHDLKVGSILKIKAAGFFTQELVYDGFFRISYYLTSDTYYKPMDGPRQYNITNASSDSIELSFSFDIGGISSRIETFTMIYKRISEEKVRELVGYQQEYVKFMLE